MSNYYIAVILFFALPLCSYGQLDVSPTVIVYPEDSQTVHFNFTYEIEFAFKNVGASPVPKNTIVPIDLLYDGQFYQTFNLNTQNTALQPNDSIMVTIPAQNFSTASPSIELGIVTRLAGDVNSSNDTVRNHLWFNFNNFIDLKPVGVRMKIPEFDSIVPVKTNIIRLDAEIMNVGNTTLPRDFEIKLDYELYSTARTFIGRTSGALDSAEVHEVLMGGGHPKVQANPGIFAVCVTIANTNDDNSANDQYCEYFYATDFVGIQKIEHNKIISYFNGNGITLSNIQGRKALQIRLFNNMGQMIQSARMPEDIYQFEIPTKPGTGLVIVQVSDENGEVIHFNRIVNF